MSICSTGVRRFVVKGWYIARVHVRVGENLTVGTLLATVMESVNGNDFVRIKKTTCGLNISLVSSVGILITELLQVSWWVGLVRTVFFLSAEFEPLNDPVLFCCMFLRHFFRTQQAWSDTDVARTHFIQRADAFITGDHSK